MNWLQSLIGGQAALNITVNEVASELRHNPDKPFLLDVREQDEFTAGHITGSSLIPLGQLARRLDELPRDQRIVCICRSGNRSGTATRLLRNNGLEAVNMAGGMLDWARQGLPITRG